MICFIKEGEYPKKFYPASDKKLDSGFFIFRGKVGELHGKIRGGI